MSGDAPLRARLPARWTHDSLRLRVLVAMLAWVTLGIGGVWYSATRLFEKHVEEQYHEEMAVHIRELAGLVRVERKGHLSLIRPLSDPRYLVPLSGFYWQVSIAGGERLRSASMTRGGLDEEVAHSAHILHRTEHGPTGPAITYGFTRSIGAGRDVHYLIATDQRLLDIAIDRFTRELFAWLGVLAVLLLAAGFAVVVFGFRPLDRLAAAVSHLRGGNFTGLRGRFPSEIAPLVDDLNVYIAHSGTVVERGRVEAGALAHGVRTPLAVITDEAERLARDPATAASAAVLLRQTQLMSQQIEFRLARARSAAGSGLPGAVSRLADVLPPILSALRRLHPDVAFEIEPAIPVEAVLPIDPVDLTELVSNVLDNAGKWARSRVSVCVDDPPGQGLSIIDDGPGMTAADAARACQIGTRFDQGQPGSGLGLAIARDIADSYRLDLVLGPRPDGGEGLHVSLRPHEG